MGLRRLATPRRGARHTQQLVTLDVTTGERFQVTHLPAPPPLPPDVLPTYNPLLRQNGTISFRTFTNPNELNPGGSNQILTVEPDGTDLKLVPIPVVLPGGGFGPIQITSAQPTSLRLSLSDGTSEIFFSDHNNLLQLTNFGLSDTIPGTVELDGQRVFFGASVDPFGTNPTRNCQIFTIDRNATDLHQLTQFGQDVPSAIGCGLFATGAPPGCTFQFINQDAATRALLFYSSCDPFGTNPYGDQLFVMHPDGTDLRQLTDARGFIADADGTVMAELPGPFASTAVRR